MLAKIQNAQEVVRSNPELNPKALLGMGVFAVVWLAEWGEQQVAVKVPNMGKDKNADLFREEVRLLQQLDSPGVVKCLKVFDAGFIAPHAILEYCPAKSLDGYLEEYSRCSTLEQVQLTSQIATAVSYIHEKGIVHLDLKPANILLDVYGNAKISDFGLALEVVQLSKFTISSQARGTPMWKAPESLVSPFIMSQAGDVWSMSIIFMQVVNGEKKPFVANTAVQLHNFLTNNPFPAIKTADEDFRNIIEKGTRLTYLPGLGARSTAKIMADSLTNLLSSLEKKFYQAPEQDVDEKLRSCSPMQLSND
jgi:eukaryotic-like serine/threonine-protein kinase